jgi:bifunctional N-acetylglucosamine-1-phosphate-uridyltransferase/glucosamine-1-phosphate-acetyltransferase GlmU-like protein
MPPRKANVFKVVVLAAGADALLRSRRPRVLPPLGAKEKILELVHSGVGKQQRRIVGRHQRGRVHPAVPLRLKKAQKCFAYLVPRSILHGLSV